MTNYKFIKNDNDNKSSNTSNVSNTAMPAENRQRHKPARGLPRTEK